MSLGDSLAAFQSLRAPTFDVEVIRSPEILSTQLNEDTPVYYFSKMIEGDKASIAYNLIIPLIYTITTTSSPGLNERSTIASFVSFAAFFTCFVTKSQ